MLRSAITLLAFTAITHAVDLSVASSGGNKTSTLQYGLMFEDINHSGDGGIYAELIQNRAFQGNAVYNSVIKPWTAVGAASLALQNLSQPLSSALPTSLRVTASGSDASGISNPGWWGIDVAVKEYTGSFYVKGAYSGDFTASLKSVTNEVLGSATITSKSVADDWTEHTYTLTPSKAADNVNNTFVLTFDPSGASDGYLDFNLISLFPPTYNNHGLREDIMESLAALNPSFLRLPGGNNLEGNLAPYLWKWNETIGPLKDRPGRPGTWGYENTDGLGLIEYMQWCDDLDMEPILAVWAGYYLNGVTLDNATVQYWVQYALDELEFLMGDTSTTYGALRASLGYPDPWAIKYVEVGNEDNLSGTDNTYNDYRFPSFYNAIKAKYPDMIVISTNLGITLPGDSAADYHLYSRPNNMAAMVGYFDHLIPGHDILIGEYAVIDNNENTGSTTGINWSAKRPVYPWWIGAVGEAIFLLGAERNTDHVIGASYAPLLQNMNSYEWTPDLISFDASESSDVLSTSYHMIKLWSGTRFTTTLPVSGGSFNPAYWVAGVNEDTGSHIMKLAVYNSTADVDFSVTFEGVSGGEGTLTVLTAPSGASYNSLGGTDPVITTTSTVTSSNGSFEFSLPELSVALFEVKSAVGQREERVRKHGPRGPGRVM